MLTITPRLSVTANPLIVPDPSKKRTTDEISVVTLESKIAVNARENPF